MVTAPLLLPLGFSVAASKPKVTFIEPDAELLFASCVASKSMEWVTPPKSKRQRERELASLNWLTMISSARFSCGTTTRMAAARIIALKMGRKKLFIAVAGLTARYY